MIEPVAHPAIAARCATSLGEDDLIAMRRFSAPPDRLGENPLWNDRTGRLEWIDVLGETQSSCLADGSDLQREALPGEPGGFAYRTQGGRLISYRRRLALREENGSEQDIPLPLFDVEQERFNDCACDSRGRLWVGTMAPDYRSPTGALYRLDPDLSFHRMDEGVIISNGIGWSPDETILYYCDSGRGIFAYDYDVETGSISNRRSFATFGESEGSPDGSAVDAEGFLWVAMAGGRQILRLAPDGSVALKVPMTVDFPASVSFGGEGLKTLYITSMVPFDDTPPGPDDGLVFAFEPGVAGLPMHRFGG